MPFTRLPFVLALLPVLAALSSHPALAQVSGAQPPSLPLGGVRPESKGITRTVLKDDAKATVTRVRFEPNAEEQPHTHPNDVILVPVTAGPVELAVGATRMTALAAGEVQFVPRDVTHYLKNTGAKAFEIVAISLK